MEMTFDPSMLDGMAVPKKHKGSGSYLQCVDSVKGFLVGRINSVVKELTTHHADSRIAINDSWINDAVCEGILEQGVQAYLNDGGELTKIITEIPMKKFETRKPDEYGRTYQLRGYRPVPIGKRTSWCKLLFLDGDLGIPSLGMVLDLGYLGEAKSADVYICNNPEAIKSLLDNLK